MKRNAKIDANQPEIVKALRDVGAYVLHTHQLKNAFDILVAFRGKLFVMEIKNPDALPKEYDRQRLEKALSTGELECMREFQNAGVDYHIVTTADQALNIILNG